MGESEQQPIPRAVRTRTSGDVQYVNVPGMGHDFLTYESLTQSFRERGRFDPSVSRTILRWLRTRHASR